MVHGDRERLEDLVNLMLWDDAALHGKVESEKESISSNYQREICEISVYVKFCFMPKQFVANYGGETINR